MTDSHNGRSTHKEEENGDGQGAKSGFFFLQRLCLYGKSSGSVGFGVAQNVETVAMFLHKVKYLQERGPFRLCKSIKIEKKVRRF